jgi:hypothetical protein
MELVEFTDNGSHMSMSVKQIVESDMRWIYATLPRHIGKVHDVIS